MDQPLCHICEEKDGGAEFCIQVKAVGVGTDGTAHRWINVRGRACPRCHDDLKRFHRRRVALGVDDAEEAEGLVVGIAQLVDGVRRDVDRVEVVNGICFRADDDFPLPSQADDDMLVAVAFMAAVPAGSDLEVAEMKLRRFPAVADKDLP